MSEMTAEEKTRILIVEDEPEIRRFLRVTLVNHGFDLVEATKAQEGLDALVEKQPQLVILDLGLPDMDGVDFTKRVREWSNVPIIVLSARSMESDKIDALEAGADDYVTKPFGVLELIARIRVSMRRVAQVESAPGAVEPLFVSGDLEVDLVKRKVTVSGEEIHLTPTEYKILHMLVKNADCLVTQKNLLREIWGPGYAKEGHYLRVYVGQLRQKLEKEPARPKYIITEPGVGYRLRVVQNEDEEK